MQLALIIKSFFISAGNQRVRQALDQGLLSHQKSLELFESGLLGYKFRYFATTTSRRKLRAELKAASSLSAKEFSKRTAHHLCPLSNELTNLRNRILAAGVDPNKKELGILLSPSFHKLVHGKKTRGWQAKGDPFLTQWLCFFKEKPNRTAVEIEGFARNLKGIIEIADNGFGTSVFTGDDFDWKYSRNCGSYSKPLRR